MIGRWKTSLNRRNWVVTPMCSPKPIFEDFSMVNTRVSTKYISALCNWGYHWGLGGERFSILGFNLELCVFQVHNSGWNTWVSALFCCRLLQTHVEKMAMDQNFRVPTQTKNIKNIHKNIGPTTKKQLH